MQGVCYPDRVAPPALAPADLIHHIPIRIVNGQALIEITLGGVPLTALLDTGASSMSLPRNMADTLIASGEATEKRSRLSSLMPMGAR